MPLAQARFNMVEQQIRCWDVLDQTVLDLMLEMPRDHFVPDAYQRLAYADIAVPLGEEQAMMPPRVEARMLQSLGIQPGDAALEIGTGSGFVTALLARLARHVTSVEISPEFAARAADTLREHGAHNVTLEVGDALHGWPQAAPYDVIALTGSLPAPDESIRRQLEIGGRLFQIVGNAPAMEAMLVTRTGPDQWAVESLFETVVPPLLGAEAPERFVL